MPAKPEQSETSDSMRPLMFAYTRVSTEEQALTNAMDLKRNARPSKSKPRTVVGTLSTLAMKAQVASTSMRICGRCSSC